MENDFKKLPADIFHHALRAVDSYRAVEGRTDEIRKLYREGNFTKLLVVGFGKAACRMAKAVEDRLGDIIESGILITKYGHIPKDKPRKFEIYEAGHPVPDENGLRATEKIISILNGLDEKTIVLCLISGGGSALLVSPYEGITLHDKQNITEMLLKSGADINELNTVRKHLSKVKGGRLAEFAYPAKVISLIISDVIGDRLDVIASGPTAPDNTTYADAFEVLRRYSLMDASPRSVSDLLIKGMRNEIPETPKEGNKIFVKVKNIIVGNNKTALEAAERKAGELGLDAEILSAALQGEAREVGRWLAEEAKERKRRGVRGLCLISGGETTVTVKGKGKGGRNMELALSFAIEIEGIEDITLLSAGTDGTDGPTDAAGAIVDGRTILKARTIGLEPERYLKDNDSYAFFKKVEGLFVTGPTGTNVMDIQLIVIK